MNLHATPIEDLAAALLLDVGAVQVSVAKPFKLTSGKHSPVYFDCRRLMSSPPAMNLVAGMFQLLVERTGLVVDLVAGGESAGIPFADRLAAFLGKPLVYVRKGARTHGTEVGIEGKLIPGAQAILVEDLITDGASKLGFVQSLKAAEVQVHTCFVVLDREQGGREALQALGVELNRLTTAERTLLYAKRSGILSELETDSVLRYFRQPDAWVP